MSDTPKKTRTRASVAPEVEVVQLSDVVEEQLAVAEEPVRYVESVRRPIKETYIVQNVTKGPHCVSDINLVFNPFEIVDLTYEDPEKVLSSRHLKRSLQSGILRRITADEADKIQAGEIERNKQKMLRDQKIRQRQRDVVESEDGSRHEVEVSNINVPVNGKEEVSTTGHINDAMTYAMAFAKAESAAKRQGRTLDPYEFAQRLGDNNQLLNRLAFGSNVDAESTSGDSRRGRATYAAPDEDGNTNPFTVDMTNFNRDHRVAGNDSFDFLETESAIAESIDLNLDADETDARPFRRT